MTRIEVPGRDDIVGIRAANPGPFTLSGTNSWIVGRDPAWLVDPGPALAEHVDALAAEIDRRGGLGGIALTHDHADHSEAVPALRDRFPGRAAGGGARRRRAPARRRRPRSGRSRRSHPRPRAATTWPSWPATPR